MADTPAPAPGSAQVEANLAHAATAEGMPDTGVKAVTEHGGAGYVESKALGLDATAWVSVAMLAFIAILLWRKVPALITGGLDKQIAAIRARLDEAKALRAEAETLRNEYAAKLAAIETSTAEMVAHAEEESKALIAKAKKDADELVKRRTRMAEDKIAAAERAALQEVRAKAADAAARAAGTIIAAKHDPAADKALVDRTIAGLNRIN